MVFESVRGYVQLASGLSELTRARATEAAQGLLSMQGTGIETGSRLAVQVSALAEELLVAATTNRHNLTALVRTEVDAAIGRLGLVPAEKLQDSQAEAARLRAEIEALRSAPSRATPAKNPAVKKATAKKATAKKATAKKATAKKATAKKATAKKATAKKATAKKATAAKTPTAKRATAKRATAAKPATATRATAKTATAKATPAKQTPVAGTGVRPVPMATTPRRSAITTRLKPAGT